MLIVFPNYESFLLSELKEIERKLIPLCEKRDLCIIWLGVACVLHVIMCLTELRGAFIVTMTSCFVIGLYMVYLFKSGPLLQQRSRVLATLSRTDKVKYEWLLNVPFMDLMRSVSFTNRISMKSRERKD